ncbi:MAG: hypothetical protein ACE366_19240 [Bradymonadia bacterium]
MSDDATRGPTSGGSAGLEISPLSARIQAEAEHRWFRRPHLVSMWTPSGVEGLIRGISRPIQDLAQVEPDPEGMTMLKGIDEPRDLERPYETNEHLETITPQFFLRNTHRVERFADPLQLDFYGYMELGEREDPWIDIEVARVCGEGHVEMGLDIVELSSQLVTAQVADKHRLVVETAWADTFGRADEED